MTGAFTESLMTIVNAYAAMSAKSKLDKFLYEPKALEQWDVEIKISHCGICHSDVHLIDDDWGVSVFPLVPGHEIIGEVMELGSQVNHLQNGQRVGVGWQSGSCLTCEWCVSGHENLCPHEVATCVGHHGGFADRIRIDSRFAFPIPEKLKSAEAAPLLCGGVTVYSPFRIYNVLPSMKVGVIGIGGLGHLALQFARAFGYEVTAFSSSANKEAEARKFGAHHFIHTKTISALKEVANSFDFILNTTFSELDWAGFVKALRRNGKICTVGATANNINVPAELLLGGQRAICGSVIGNRWMIREMLEFAARHDTKAQIETTPLSEVNAAIETVRNGKARYRIVLENLAS
jgi:uncharacterized zinc-type alcohol dehydrogenase-like protein